jgi:hypothetical protein
LLLLHLSAILQVVHYVPKLVSDLKNQAYVQKCFQKHENNYKGCIIMSHFLTNILDII